MKVELHVKTYKQELRPQSLGNYSPLTREHLYLQALQGYKSPLKTHAQKEQKTAGLERGNKKNNQCTVYYRVKFCMDLVGCSWVKKAAGAGN